MVFRDATSNDAAAIACMHAESWRSAYRGTFSDDYLENRVHEDRRESWQKRFSGGAHNPMFAVLAEMGGELAGFACVYPDQDAVFGSLVENLHVAPQFTGRGIGRRLLAEVVHRLRARGSERGLYLWMNRTIAPVHSMPRQERFLRNRKCIPCRTAKVLLPCVATGLIPRNSCCLKVDPT